MASRHSSRKPSAQGRGRGFSGFLIKLALVLLVIGGLGLVYLDATIRSQFEGRRWALPARVYASPLELWAGRKLSAQELRAHLEALGYRRDRRPDRPGEFVVGQRRILVQSRDFRFSDGLQRGQWAAVSFDGNRIAALEGPAGEPISLLRLDPLLIGGIYPQSREDRELVRLEDVPETLTAALLATEDRDFYQHFGVSLKGIARALWNNLRAGSVVQGGSTLTQQLVKNYFLTAERTLWRKLVELPMAVLLELHYDKREILEAYLNEVYLGQDGARAIHGFGLAAQHYFGRPLADLTLAQQALLVGMVKGPSYYDPRRYPERAKGRRDLVLRLMVEQGVLAPERYAVASQEPLGVRPRDAISKGRFPAYLDLVRRQLARDYRPEDLGEEGLRIFTAFDPLVQEKAERSVQSALMRLERRFGKPLADLQAAVVVGNSQTGEVLAVVGGRDPSYQGFNRALDAVRPIGSLVKPAVYLAALEQPGRYTLATMLDDAPVSVRNPDGSLWQPQNYDRKAHGKVPLHRALAHSYNLATARLGMEVGMDAVVDVLRRLGLRRPLEPYPATLLGSLSLSPIEVMQLYQTIAANGFESPLRAIRAVTDSEGRLLSRYPYRTEQKFDPAVVHLLQYALQEVVREGTGRALYGLLPEQLAVAGKTGTTNDQRDSWFAGFSGDYLAVAWLGMDDNRPTPLTGSSGALRVWADLFGALVPEPYQMTVPESVRYLWIDDTTGARTDAWCENARELPFVAGSEPKAFRPCGQQLIRRTLNWFNRLLEGQ